MPQMSQILRERVIGMLTEGMSTSAVADELNVNFSTISCLQRLFREFGSTSNRPHNRSSHVTTFLHIFEESAQQTQDLFCACLTCTWRGGEVRAHV